MDSATASVTLHLDGSTAGFRLAAYFRSLARPRGFGLVVLVAAFPFLIGEAVGLFAPDDRMRASFLLVGLAAAFVLVAIGALTAVARRMPASTLTFDADGIREIIGARTLQHDWSWIVEVVEDERNVTLFCQTPMKSFQLASSADRRTIVLGRSAEVDRLVAWARAARRPTGRAAPASAS